MSGSVNIDGRRRYSSKTSPNRRIEAVNQLPGRIGGRMTPFPVRTWPKGGRSEGAGATMFRKKSVVLTLTVVTMAFVGTVLATPGSGVLSSSIWARAAFEDPVDIKVKVQEGHQEVIHVPNAQDTVMQQIVLAPRGHTGWHSHPGPAIALIKSGALTLYSGDDATCSGRTYSAGQAFVDHGQGHVHMGRNLSTTENAEVWVTYLDVPPGASVRLDQPNPGNCAF
jgi:hypothetical protein